MIGLVALNLISCGSESPKARRSIDCKLSSNFTGCSANKEGGNFVWDLSDSKEDQEYVIVLWNQSEFRENDYFQRSEFSISSSFSSKSIPAEEERLKGKIIGKLPQGNEADDSEVEEWGAHVPTSIRFQLNHDSNAGQSSIDGDTSKTPQPPAPAQHYFYLRNSDDPSSRGEKAEFEEIHASKGHYAAFMDKSVNPTQASEFQSKLGCLDQAVSETIDWLGRPIQIGKESEIALLISPIQSDNGMAIGSFNFLDLFESYKGRLMPDANFRESIRLSPDISDWKLCATTSHEIQHLISYLYKVMQQIPEPERGDFESVQKYQLMPEQASLDEGFSHNIEELVQGAPYVNSHMTRFLKSPSETSLSLEAAGGLPLHNIKTRGFATLLIQHALARAGATLDKNDPLTRNLFKKWIASPETGLDNIAKTFEQNKNQFLEHFFTSLSSTLFDSGRQNTLIPAQNITEEQVKGLKFFDRTEEVIEIKAGDIHPLMIDLPLVRRSNTMLLRPEAFAMIRLIVPHDKKDATLVFKSKDNPYSIFITRVR